MSKSMHSVDSQSLCMQGSILGKVNTVLAMGKDDPAKEDSVKAVSKQHKLTPGLGW